MKQCKITMFSIHSLCTSSGFARLALTVGKHLAISMIALLNLACGIGWAEEMDEVGQVRRNLTALTCSQN